MTEELGAFRADQFHLIGNTHANEPHTAEEMWSQAGGNIDVFVDFVGSGGPFAGCAKALKEHKPDIRCYVVEPESAAHFAGLPITNPLPPVDPALIDGTITVGNDEAAEFARRGRVFVGFSSGANVCAAIKLLTGRRRARTSCSP